MSARAPIRARTFSGSRRSQRDSPVSGCAAGCVAADRQGSVDGLSALVVAAVVAWRLVNALLVQSSFVPDEYWQALEVAHRWVFGYGHLTWEWSFGLRGVTHPLVFASLYRGLQLLGADTPWAVVHAPRLLQGVFLALADIYVYRVAHRWFGPAAAQWTLALSLLSFMNFYCGVRTLSNTMEAVVTPVALFYWPDDLHTAPAAGLRQQAYAVLLAGLACLFRPTAGITWCLMAVQLLIKGAIPHVLRFTAVGAVGAVVCLCWSVVADYGFYGKWVIIQYEFLRFNLLQGSASFYGTHAGHWYLTQGFPVVMGTSLPLLLYGAVLAPARRRAPLWVALGVLMAYSVSPHKEFRFTYSLLFLCLPFCGLAASRIRAAPSRLLLALALVNLPAGLYLGMIHQRGALDVMGVLREEISHASGEHRPSILFLTQCHATPLYSHLHANVSTAFLECPPPGAGDDVASDFFHNPAAWLASRGSALVDGKMPSHVVMSTSLLDRDGIPSWLSQHGFALLRRVFHSHFVESDRTGTHFAVYRRALAVSARQSAGSHGPQPTK